MMMGWHLPLSARLSAQIGSRTFPSAHGVLAGGAGVRVGLAYKDTDL